MKGRSVSKRGRWKVQSPAESPSTVSYDTNWRAKSSQDDDSIDSSVSMSLQAQPCRTWVWEAKCCSLERVVWTQVCLDWSLYMYQFETYVWVTHVRSFSDPCIELYQHELRISLTCWQCFRSTFKNCRQLSGTIKLATWGKSLTLHLAKGQLHDLDAAETWLPAMSLLWRNHYHAKMTLQIW